jgi:DNA processing protein
MTEIEAYLALNLVPHVGPVRLRKMLAHFGGSPVAVLQARAAELSKISGLDSATIEAVTKWEDEVDLLGELEKIRERGLTLMTQNDELYPPLLRETHSAPFLLYVWGRLDKRDHQAVGVVGSRVATHYGLDAAKRFSYGIAYAGYTVISGLARGIDTAAHEAALAAKGRTVAVIGSGIGQLYPPENAALAARIAENGAVVSEYPVDRMADKKTFPYRNRIVAAWSRGVLVVEAPGRSGSLITAQQALEAGRTIFAVPGPINRAESLGCHRLIQQGAKLVVDVDDILDELRIGGDLPELALDDPRRAAGETARAQPLVELTLEEKIVVEALTADGVLFDELMETCGLTPATLSSTLVRLELKRVIRQLPGRRYCCL